MSAMVAVPALIRAGGGWSVRRHLTVLVAGILLPAFLFAGLVANLYAQRERARLQGAVTDLSRGILHAIDLEITGLENALQALSTSQALRRGDFESFAAQALAAKGFNGIDVVARDPTGQQVVNTRAAPGAPLPRVSRSADNEAARLRRPYVSDLVEGAVSRSRIFTVTTAVFADDGTTPLYFLNLSVQPERIAAILRQVAVPEGWVATVLDRAGTVIAREPGHAAFIGRNASEQFLTEATGLSGQREGVNLAGVHVLTSYVRSPRFGWTVVAGVPTELLNAPLRRSLLLLAAGGAALLLLSLLMAVGFGARISGPIRSLALHAEALRSGREAVHAVTGLAEVDAVGDAFARGVAQRKAAEAALAAANKAANDKAAERAAILAQLTEGVIIADAKGKIVFVNNAAARLHGVSELNVEPNHYGEVYRLFTLDGRPHPVDDLPLVRAVKRGETVLDARWRIERADGSVVLASGNAQPIFGPDGARIGSVLTLRDDTQREADAQEQTRLNETLAMQAADLRESNEELQRYAYIVSHDLRAPLVNIMGFTSEIESLQGDLRPILAKAPDGERIDQDLGEALSFIKAAISKMERLIAAILKVSREGRRPMRPERLDMIAVVQGLADAIRHQTDLQDAQIRVAPGLPPMTADRLAVEQIFGNLLDNAVKYLSSDRPGDIIVRGHERGNHVVYQVEDNGRGIAPQDHARVFELFRRSGSQDRSGEGIGLAHVKTLVRALSGHISLASRPGEGTVFTLTFPKTAMARATERQSAA